MNKYNVQIPFYCLAPMANITTFPFASQALEYGADLAWTPMVHSDALIHNPDDTFKIIEFKNTPNYIVQIIGSDPLKMSKAAEMVSERLNPAGIDINFACPDKNIIKSGCGGYLMSSPSLMLAIIEAVKGATDLPISVKTRAGYENNNEILGIAELFAGKIDLLAVHGRTVKQAFTGEADWSVLKKLKGQLNPKTLLVGSGDILTWKQAIETQNDTNVDGVMIGRGALGNPWIFEEIKNGKPHEHNIEEIKRLTLDLAIKANEIWGTKGIVESKKHFAWYFKGFDGAAEYRKKLMAASNLNDVKHILT